MRGAAAHVPRAGQFGMPMTASRGPKPEEAASAGLKTEAILEALPYICRYVGKTIVIKVGGAVGDDGTGTVLEDIVWLKKLGINPVVVHGGGAADLADARLGWASRRASSKAGATPTSRRSKSSTPCSCGSTASLSRTSTATACRRSASMAWTAACSTPGFATNASVWSERSRRSTCARSCRCSTRATSWSSRPSPPGPTRSH